MKLLAKILILLAITSWSFAEVSVTAPFYPLKHYSEKAAKADVIFILDFDEDATPPKHIIRKVLHGEDLLKEHRNVIETVTHGLGTIPRSQSLPPEIVFLNIVDGLPRNFSTIAINKPQTTKIGDLEMRQEEHSVEEILKAIEEGTKKPNKAEMATPRKPSD